MAGGWFASKYGLKKSVVPLALILNVPNVLFTYLAVSQNNHLWVVIVCASIEKFSLGMGFVAMTLVLMQQMAPGKFSTAHYGFATALMGASMMVPSMTSGFVSDLLGYKRFFIYILIIGLPSIIISALVPIRDNPGSTEVPDDDKGAAMKTASWATALSTGSLYLFITFSGLLMAPVFFGEPVSWAYVVIFGILLVLGFALLGTGAKTALAAREMVRKLGGGVKTQSGLALTLAAIGAIIWVASMAAIWNKQRQMMVIRDQCSSSHEESACAAVCKNDGTYDVCSEIMKERVAEFDAKPDDTALASAALEVTTRTLVSGCFVMNKAADCMSLGEMNATPGRWAKAGVEEDVCEAKRYYAKACTLSDSRGCELARQAKHRIATEKPHCKQDSGGGE
jgi:hypothetical protein